MSEGDRTRTQSPSSLRRSGSNTVSVVMSTYNRENWLRQAVDSVLRQNGVDLELIIVNNGCVDGTANYLDSVDDSRVKVIVHDENIGMVPAKNSGLSEARGDWVALIDDDDVWAPDKLLRQLTEVESTGLEWSTTGCVYINGDLEIIGGVPPPSPDVLVGDLVRRYTLQGGASAFLWRRGTMQSDLINESVPNMSDWELSLRLARRSRPAVVYAPLVGYRQHASSMSQTTNAFPAELDRMAAIFEEIVSEKSRPYVYEFVGSQLLRRNRRAEAGRFFVKAMVNGRVSAGARFASVWLPESFRNWLRVKLWSDPAWMAEGEAWLGPMRRQSDTV